jgi:tetratricopeptide (TPR) repeat protein
MSQLARRGVVLGLLAGLLAAGAARADDEAEGRGRFKRGQELYNDGRFLEAAAEFEAGFAAAPRPLFLLNIGHSYRRAGELRKAKRAYELLLRVDPTTQYRAEVESLVTTIDDALQSAEPLPGSTSASGPSQRFDGTSAATPPAPPLVTATGPASETESRPLTRNPWFWGVVGGVLVAGVVGAVIGLNRSAGCNYSRCLTEPPRR